MPIYFQNHLEKTVLENHKKQRKYLKTDNSNLIRIQLKINSNSHFKFSKCRKSIDRHHSSQNSTNISQKREAESKTSRKRNWKQKGATQKHTSLFCSGFLQRQCNM